MPASEQNLELIRKYLDDLASEPEIAALEKLLASDGDVANAFADEARLHANLQAQLRHQYKVDQITALLGASDQPSASECRLSEGKSAEPTRPDPAGESRLESGSRFIPGRAQSMSSRRKRFSGRFEGPSPRWRWIAAAVLIVALGAAIWTALAPRSGQLRLISGRVSVAGREVASISWGVEFAVAGKNAAVIQLPGGARMELIPATRALIGGDSARPAVQLLSGGGQFHVQGVQSQLQVETALGVMTAQDARFSLNLMTTPPEDFTPTAPVPLPNLAVAVAQGAVSINHAGVTITLSAGEQHVFTNPT